MELWSFLHQKIQSDIPVALLCVLDSQGSSPGRQGFKMAVSVDGAMTGSIGGGIMELKLVETAKDLLNKKEKRAFFKPQIHRKTSPVNQSGMICSGDQTVVIYPLFGDWKQSVRAICRSITAGKTGLLHLSPSTIRFETGQQQARQYTYQPGSEEDWQYSENLGQRNILHIIGGGHVGLAFSKQMSMLDFYIRLFDDRPALNTFTENTYVDEKQVVDYDHIGRYIEGGDHHYVVIMSFGYRPDKLVLRQLIDKPFRYIGMMGSEAKVRQLFSEYEKEGLPRESFAHVHAPIGIPIYSKTPEEIAVSIAAEIIRSKNAP